jgi:lysophospholipase L1-like esterase
MFENVIVFGDSIAYGSWDKAGGWVDRLKLYRESKREEDLKYYLTYNLGVPGETVVELNKRFEIEVSSRVSSNIENNQIIFAFGMNDLAIDIDGNKRVSQTNFYELYYQIIKQAKTYASSVVILNITPINQLSEDLKNDLPRSNENIIIYNKLIKKLSDNLHIKLIDVHNEFIINNVKNLLDKDGLHPNTHGHQLIFEKVVDEI